MVVGNKDFTVGRKEGVQALPPVADDGRTAGGCFKQADAGRVPGLDHVAAGDVERGPLRGIKSAVFHRGQMFDALHVRRPCYAVGILRPGHDKAARGPLPGGFA